MNTNEDICVMNQTLLSQLNNCTQSSCGPNAVCTQGENTAVCNCPFYYPAGNPYDSTKGCLFVEPSLIILIKISFRFAQYAQEYNKYEYFTNVRVGVNYRIKYADSRNLIKLFLKGISKNVTTWLHLGVKVVRVVRLNGAYD